jgi:hypothetical protein
MKAKISVALQVLVIPSLSGLSGTVSLTSFRPEGFVGILSL